MKINEMSEKREYLFKVLVVGNSGVGKTSLVQRYANNAFHEKHKTTIGVDFALKVLNYDQNTLVRMQLWDISGQERYGNMTKVYYRGAVGAVVVFDITNASTFEAVASWKNDLDNKARLPNGSSIPVVLVGNKCDALRDGLRKNQSQMNKFCVDTGFASWFQTSAKNNTSIDDAMRYLVDKMLGNDSKNPVEQLTDSVKLERETAGMSSEENSKITKRCCF